MTAPVQGTEERRRLKRRISQRIRRTKQKRSKEDLENQVLELSRANDYLASHVLVLQRGLWCHAQHQAIVKYYRLFTNGYVKSEGQNTFLHNFIHPDVHFNGSSGFDAFVAPWMLYAAIFSTNRVECKQIADLSTSSDEAVIQAQAVTTMTFGMAAISTLLPRAIERRDLVNKLLGWQMELPIRTVFTFDSKTRTVTHLTTEPDMIPSLLGCLGNLEDVMAILPPPGHHPDLSLFPIVRPSVPRDFVEML
ncbi:hypothetical protein LEN26_006057 [Aphanomyces euteiches]|nr:hypothetical protein LEN26_006057 [Aphanomyces euteiches]